MSDKKKLAIKYFPASELVTFPGNPRKLKDADAVKKLTKLIEAHGFQNPLQVWQHEGVNYILCGNHRFKAACDLGYTEFPCIVYTGTKEEALARVISDNKSSDWTEFDYPLLKDMITEIDLGHLDIEITGFGEEELEALFGYEGLTEEEQAEKDAIEDEVPDVPVEPVTRPGDLYLLGRHRLLCGDSTNITDVERLMDGKKADMVFTSPPYNGNTVGIDGQFGNCVNPLLYKDNSIDNKTSDEYIGFNKAIFASIDMATNDNAVIFYNINYNKNSPSEYIKVINNSLDIFALQETIVWVKHIAISLAGDNLTRIYEFIFMLKKGNGLAMKKEHHACIKNLWEISNTNTSIKGHRACFPVGLPVKAIELMDCNIILDPFLGSGSTLIACEKTGRACYGMELDTHYCDVIVARWEKFTGKKATLCQPS